MKKFILLTSIILLYVQGFAQKKPVETRTAAPVQNISREDIQRSPFSKGIWELTATIPDLQYIHKNIKTNGVDQGSLSNFALDLGTNYYVADHIGIGVELLSSINVFKSPNNSDQHNSSWMTYANFTYGTTSDKTFNIYGRAGIGLGGGKEKYTAPNGNTTTDKSDLFGYKLSVGFPIQLNRGVTYFTPEFGYRYQRDKFGGITETDNRFGLNLKLETFMFCKEMQCDAKMHHAFSHGAYEQGRSFLGVSTRGSIDFGSVKTEYTNNFPGSKQTYSNGDLDFCYKYYVVHNLALGAGLQFGSSVYKNSAANAKQTSSNFLLMPMVELNMPSENQALNNLFVMGGYGFGSQRTEYKTGNNTSTTKYSTTDLCFGIGYNFFFHQGLSFTPAFEYDMATSKDKTTDIETKYRGPELELGIRKFFR